MLRTATVNSFFLSKTDTQLDSRFSTRPQQQEQRKGHSSCMYQLWCPLCMSIISISRLQAELQFSDFLSFLPVCARMMAHASKDLLYFAQKAFLGTKKKRSFLVLFACRTSHLNDPVIIGTLLQTGDVQIPCMKSQRTCLCFLLYCYVSRNWKTKFWEWQEGFYQDLRW